MPAAKTAPIISAGGIDDSDWSFESTVFGVFWFDEN